MNYEKWPFNLVVLLNTLNRCILFHFQLWIVYDCLRFYSIPFRVFFISLHFHFFFHTLFRSLSTNTYTRRIDIGIVNWLSVCRFVLHIEYRHIVERPTQFHITFQMHTYRCQSNDFNYGVEFILNYSYCCWSYWSPSLRSQRQQSNILSNRWLFFFDIKAKEIGYDFDHLSDALKRREKKSYNDKWKQNFIKKN